MATKKSFLALGIMNGTSIDGIDFALIQSSSDFQKLVFKKHKHFPMEKKLRATLLKAACNELTTYDLSKLHFDLGRYYAQCLKKLKATWKWDVIGLHGQTVHHEGRLASLQIGHPGFMAEHTNTPIVYDFRSADIVSGGEGAPFAPFFQNVIGKSASRKAFAFHNLGGISNLTYFNKNQVTAFDTGPANILLDQWIEKKKKKSFDKNGQFASQGLPDPKVVEKMLKHTYFFKKAPKSCGREEFNLDYIKKYGGSAFEKLSFVDQMATLVELTALSIARSYKQEFKALPEKIYFYGGGVNNPYLMSRISYHLPECEILTTQDLGWPTQALEASTFAFLALARMLNKKVHLPQVTGAKNTRHLGSLYSL